MIKVIIRKEFPNPENIKKLGGIAANIISAGWRGEDLVIFLETIPTEAQLNALLSMVRTGKLWKIVKVEEVEV